MGAAVGAAVAMGLYGVYAFAAPPMQALVAGLVHTAPPKYTEADRAERQRMIVEKAKEILAIQVN